MKKSRRKTAKTPRSDIWESRDVIELVGIEPTYLNKLIERGSFEIRPSRPGSGRGSRRWFTSLDVAGIALVWWLFKSGLRSQTIEEVLASLPRWETGADNPVAENANYLVSENPSFDFEGVLVIRHPLQAHGKKGRGVTAALESPRVPRSDSESVLVVPFGSLMNGLTRRIVKLRPDWSEWAWPEQPSINL